MSGQGLAGARTLHPGAERHRPGASDAPSCTPWPSPSWAGSQDAVRIQVSPSPARGGLWRHPSSPWKEPVSRPLGCQGRLSLPSVPVPDPPQAPRVPPAVSHGHSRLDPESQSWEPDHTCPDALALIRPPTSYACSEKRGGPRAREVTKHKSQPGGPGVARLSSDGLQRSRPTWPLLRCPPYEQTGVSRGEPAGFAWRKQELRQAGSQMTQSGD